MSDKEQYFSLKLNATGNEYDVVFADHDAYVDGVIRTPTMAVAGGLRAAYDPRYQRPDRSELCDE